MSDNQPDVGKNAVRWADLRKKLIVRPTVAGFGVVVAEHATVGPDVDCRGCCVVEVTPQYALAYTCAVGTEVAYSRRGGGIYRTWYETVDPRPHVV